MAVIAPQKRRRLSSDERRSEFIDKAIEFFAQEGFESSTRELARRLGVTQPLLYRYFPSKQELVSAVYDEVYVRRWRPEWEELIADDSSREHAEDDHRHDDARYPQAASSAAFALVRVRRVRQADPPL